VHHVLTGGGKGGKELGQNRWGALPANLTSGKKDADAANRKKKQFRTRPARGKRGGILSPWHTKGGSHYLDLNLPVRKKEGGGNEIKPQHQPRFEQTKKGKLTVCKMFRRGAVHGHMFFEGRGAGSTKGDTYRRSQNWV